MESIFLFEEDAMAYENFRVCTKCELFGGLTMGLRNRKFGIRLVSHRLENNFNAGIILS